MLVHELIRKGRPEKGALFAKSGSYSYAALQETVDRYRRCLHARGIGPGDRVGLFCHNSAEFIFAYMAIASLGAVIIPLNIMFRPREIAYILSDADSRHVVTDRPLELASAELNDSDLPLQHLLPEIGEAASAYRDHPLPDVHLTPEDPCVILYTSGTTGRPKGAVLSHRNLVSNARSYTETIKAVESDNYLCVLPLFHSFAWTCCVTTALLNGASITIMESFQPKEALALIRDCGVNVVTGVPAMFGIYNSLADPRDLANVRLFVSGGASLPVETLTRFNEKTGQSIVEGYGLSEASPVVTFNPIGATKPGSIGLPLPAVSVMIVDATGQDLPPGEVGELICQGPNVMSGYLGLPQETAAVLRDGWLYTGDLAYRDDEGYIFIVDRKKDLIIVGGLNVYPREVEEVLYAHPSVKEAAVIGMPDKTRGEAVRAFVVIRDGAELNRKELMTYLRANLASYKLPREIVELEALPRNATGKVLKKELKTR
ncbi:long-chain-fatty-acid--CoA ligase [Heliobacterium gestii]|uniref:Long-chain-fatty-acid--CoA ligase n=1 Tax=Heliomicrobium gestii TaxID=2699 RepID=A0A845LDB3_HELGE|nr:long-chain fatty acid--CoA ligase [Heliomicrobium gestii]MBM7868166.1 long-chain acyl-CoA synthetase [Heliomicrobium gestii]MZP43364.1 long-chain-fatty-acid--CoA ligase [Heliomicrobium gestii]